MLDNPYNHVHTIGDRIRCLRAYLLVHSCLYYRMSISVVSDEAWDKRARKLAQLQQLAGGEVGFFDEAFEGWTGATGYHLPVGSPYVTRLARLVLDLKPCE